MVAPPDISAGKSPRRELQGPRPTPLKLRKDSHKIRKAPPTAQQPKPPPPPVIIYTVSPKIIHANPSEFMTLVQRLTGPESSTDTSSSSVAAAAPPPSSSAPFHHNFNGSDAIPPAPTGRKQQPGFFPAVLAPNPASLQPIIPSNFFSPPSDQNPLGVFPDLSPLLHSNKNNNLETNLMMASPSPFFISPRIISPGTPSLDLLRNLFDLQHYS